MRFFRRCRCVIFRRCRCEIFREAIVFVKILGLGFRDVGAANAMLVQNISQCKHLGGQNALDCREDLGPRGLCYQRRWLGHHPLAQATCKLAIEADLLRPWILWHVDLEPMGAVVNVKRRSFFLDPEQLPALAQQEFRSNLIRFKGFGIAQDVIELLETASGSGDLVERNNTRKKSVNPASL